MPLELPVAVPTMLIRRRAFERVGLRRSEIDARYALAPDEFRTEGNLVAIGALHDTGAVIDLTQQLEALGLVFFDDFFEMSGNWPDWCRVYVTGAVAGSEE